MNEAAKFEIQKKKLQGICDEHDLIFSFNPKAYPVTLTIQPADGGAQMSFDASDEDKAFNPDSAIVFSFEDGDLTYHISESFTLSDALFSKLKNIAKKMFSFWIQFFFREIIEKGVLTEKAMPSLDDAESHADDGDLPDEAESLYDEDEMDPDDLLGENDLPDDEGEIPEDDGQTEV